MIKEFENINHLPYLTSPKHKNNVSIRSVHLDENVSQKASPLYLGNFYFS